MMTEEMRCAKHPNEVTNLRCSRCEKPVCVRCMNYTPVGIRCRECATERRSGINAPSGEHLLKAASVGAGIALVGGVLWGFFPLYGFWIALLLGFGGGELVNLAANRRRGPELQTAAAGMVIACFLLALLVSRSRTLAAFDGRMIFSTLMAALALYLAVARQK